MKSRLTSIKINLIALIMLNIMALNLNGQTLEEIEAKRVSLPKDGI
jgi:hypothetical protein